MANFAAAVERGLSWAVPATRHERAAALWSFGYFFALLAGYYVLRPLRDQMGIAGGVRNLPWLFTATFVALVVAQPLYGALVAKLPRARFIPLVYHFFVANLALFWLLLTLGVAPVIVARVFFVWVSVFSLFAVAVFWSFMADLFTAEQGKRLFGFIGAGGTAGGLLGPVITIQLAKPLGSVNLLIAAALLLEVAVFCVWQLERAATVHAATDGELHAAPQRIGGSAFAAFLDFIRSPYLLGVGLWVSLLSFCATIIYFEQANIISAAIHDRDAQTRIFAGIDLAVNLLSLATQLFITGRLLERFGTGIAAAALPAVYVVGFAALFLVPTFAVVVTLQVVQRWMNFAIANPARQVFFTVIGREEKYKAKNLIDVVVYRGSDALYGWVFDGLQALGLKLGAIALVALPAAAGWLVLSLVLGRVQEHRATLIDREAAKAQNGTPSDANLVAETTGAADFGAADGGGPMTGERA
jgi:ATP:ADP antiporter, AAA family